MKSSEEQISKLLLFARPIQPGHYKRDPIAKRVFVVQSIMDLLTTINTTAQQERKSNQIVERI
jgi:hypothetical protein